MKSTSQVIITVLFIISALVNVICTEKPCSLIRYTYTTIVLDSSCRQSFCLNRMSSYSVNTSNHHSAAYFWICYKEISVPNYFVFSICISVDFFRLGCAVGQWNSYRVPELVIYSVVLIHIPFHVSDIPYIACVLFWVLWVLWLKLVKERYWWCCVLLFSHCNIP